ncbi:hypothetical protein SDC9_113128 [bioreactor metagenome]|uniref:Uncharacterized protein n=1 Tax=bioreactor metagenome TaxID=1076179 RepID=A0A645BNS0_9ZZZZ
MLGGFLDRVPHVVDLISRGKRSHRADLYALPAVDALNLPETHVEGSRYPSVGTAVGKAQGAYRLELAAYPYTVAAENALTGVAEDSVGRKVQRQIFFRMLETHLGDTQAFGDLAQAAVAALGAGSAGLVVIGQHQLNNHFSHFADLLGVGAHHQAGFSRRGTGGNDPPSLNLHHAHAAGAVDADLGMVAESGQVDVGLAAQFQQVPLPFDGNGNMVDNRGRKLRHVRSPLI